MFDARARENGRGPAQASRDRASARPLTADCKGRRPRAPGIVRRLIEILHVLWWSGAMLDAPSSTAPPRGRPRSAETQQLELEAGLIRIRWLGIIPVSLALPFLHLDTGHLIRAAQLGKKLDPAQQVRAMGARNFGMHLKDHDNRRHTDVIYGKGALDVPAILKALREVSFKGYIAIEYEANEENPSPDIRACIEVFQQAV